MATISAAEMIGQGKVNSPWYSVMPTGSVRMLTRLQFSDSASRNSSHALTKARMPAVNTPGAASGITTVTQRAQARAAVDHRGVLEVLRDALEEAHQHQRAHRQVAAPM